MLNLHTIEVKYLGATNSRSSRVKLTSLRFGDSVTIGYNPEFNSSVDNAENWLNKNGFEPIFKSEGKNVMYLHCFVFEPLKNTDAKATWDYYEAELKKVSTPKEAQVKFADVFGGTNWMNINYASSKAIIKWLAEAMK